MGKRPPSNFFVSSLKIIKIKCCRFEKGPVRRKARCSIEDVGIGSTFGAGVKYDNGSGAKLLQL